MKVRRRLRRESRISKVVVLEVCVIRILIEKPLKSNMHGPRSQFVFPSHGVAGNAGGVFFSFASMKAGADQLEVGDRCELKGIQICGVLGVPFQRSETCAPDFRGDAPLEAKGSHYSLPFCYDFVDSQSAV